MTIYIQSRYADGFLRTDVDPRGASPDGVLYGDQETGGPTTVLRRWPAQRKPEGSITDPVLEAMRGRLEPQMADLYYWTEGDRIDVVAARLGIPPGQYHKLMDLNPALLDPSNIPVGTRLRVPRA